MSRLAATKLADCYSGEVQLLKKLLWFQACIINVLLQDVELSDWEVVGSTSGRLI